MSNLTDAVQSLALEYANSEWFLTIGLAEKPDGTIIYVYTKHNPPKGIDLPLKWYGYDVVFRRMGAVKVKA